MWSEMCPKTMKNFKYERGNIPNEMPWEAF